MNAIQDIKVNWRVQEITGWRRKINFTYDGKEYELSLFADDFGLEIYWKSENGVSIMEAPEWANNWKPEDHEDQALEDYLEELTCEGECA